MFLISSCAKNKNHETQLDTSQEETDVDINTNQESFTEEFKKCYVTFDPEGHKGNHLFKVYAQSTTKPNYYWGFTIAREQDLSDDIYSDQYRILYCKEFVYKGKEMFPTGYTLLHHGESEFTYKRLGASEPTGGFHGREKFTEISFLIDGNLINDSTTEFKMRGCKSFTYIQKSIMYREDNAHTEDATHLKTTKISDGGYFTKNTITAKDMIPMNTCFGSVVSVSVDVVEKGSAANHENVVSFNQDGKRKLEGYSDELFVWNDTKKLSANIESKFSIYNVYATQYIWDTQHYGKYYRYFQNINLNAGESWFFETKVTFDKL
ncbi:hypothetical protein [Kordia sp.]|uniref:hypothetical protein n=1 Tax=Kordia sp. TaxID=1965332 RepID=UPI00386ACFEC